jgi:threonine dehydrogenase-like Zn-dependent dehydrogenase
MHAAVLTGQAQIALEERPGPVAGEGEALIRVGAAGICGTDLHAPAMPSMFADNVVLGHEFSGTVVGGGPEAGGFEPGGFEPGRPVVVNPIALSCGSCAACRRELTNQCRAAAAAAGKAQPRRPRRLTPPARLLRSGFVDDVEGRLGHAAEPGEPGVGGEPPDRLLAGLGAE